MPPSSLKFIKNDITRTKFICWLGTSARTYRLGDSWSNLWASRLEMDFKKNLLEWKVFVTIMFNAQQSFNVENEFMGKTINPLSFCEFVNDPSKVFTFK
jgi:hypothetical protein